jgi:hypothetical protein
MEHFKQVHSPRKCAQLRDAPDRVGAGSSRVPSRKSLGASRINRNGCATKARLLLAASDEAEVGAEAEALDAHLKRSAAAVEQVIEQGLQEE